MNINNNGVPCDNNPNFPWVDDKLIEALEANIGDLIPELHWEDREIWFKSGQYSVIKLLKQHLEQQKQDK